MLNNLKRFYHNQQFYPTVWGILLNPFYFTRKGLLKEISSLSKHLSGKLLDIGCGQKPYKKLFDCDQYIGLEIDCPENRANSKADIFYDGKHIPTEDESFDAIFMSQVFEHVFNPDQLLDEIHRILKPDGVFLMTVPFLWDEHSQPFDFARYSSFGLKELFSRHNFQIISFKKSGGDIRLVFQVINLYIYKTLVGRWKYFNISLISLITFPFNLAGELLARITPKNEDLYLDNIVLVRKPK